MIAIIAEKPSLARNIVAGIGKMTRKNGYYENEKYIVTWAFGHLFTLCDVEDYSTRTEKGAKWTMDGLPCLPDRFRFKLKKTDGDDGTEKQFGIIKSLLNRSDVDSIVNAGDSDREGEIIVRLCIENALEKDKPLYRLWLPDQTPQTVASALSEMKPESEYDRLADEGFSRTYIDWLYGVNLTRYATLKTGTLLRVGRVIVPIVKAVYDRDTEIENFKPEKYYELISSEETNGEKVELVSSYKFAGEEGAKAAKCCEKMNVLDAVVTHKTSKKDRLNAGKLYSLTKLQSAVGKKYKMPMERSLAAAQKLYEAGYLTYPRTNSEYLATNEKDKIKKILSGIRALGYPVGFKDGKNIFDDSKIESHSAITPTYKIPKKQDLNEDEEIIYRTVLRRFVAVFCEEDCIAEKTEMTVSLGGKEDYVLKGLTVIRPGWTKYDGVEKKDKILPDLKVGDKVNVCFKPVEKQTVPPKHHTIESLNNYLKNPFRDEMKSEENDDEDYKAMFKGLELGTEATRTGIIDNAKKSSYISLKKDVYYIERKGRFLIEQLSAMNINMDKYKTSELGQALKKVYHGEMSVDESVALAGKELKEIFSHSSDPDGTGFYGDVIGKCPKCGKKVVRNTYSYACEDFGKGCDFKLNINILKATVSERNAKKLLADGKTEKISFVSNSGKTFSCPLRLDEKKEVKFDI